MNEKKQQQKKKQNKTKNNALKGSWTVSTCMQSRFIDYYATSSNFNWAGQTIVSI